MTTSNPQILQLNNIKSCKNCGSEFQYKSTKADFCGTICKQAHRRATIKASAPTPQKECLYCNKTFVFEKKSAKFCCLRCQQLEMRKNEFVEEVGMVSCACCDMKAHDLTKHISCIHKMSIKEYTSTHNSPIRSDKYLQGQSERIKGDKNPAYQHGGKFSALSDKFVHASITNKEEVIAKISKSNKENGNTTSTLKYWLNQGYTEDEAKAKLSERQTTFSLDICVAKHGQVEGTKRWTERQEKWLKNYKKTNFSNVSQLLFWEVYDQLSAKSDIYFATLLDGTKDTSGKNHEYVVKTKEMSVKPDFIHLPTKSVIEFDGDYGHGKHRGDDSREKTRDAALLAEGFRLLHIKERDYRSDPTKTIKQCVEFLNG